MRQYGVGSPITYYHIECPNYYTDDLVANGGVVTESFRNRQGVCEVSYKYDVALSGFVRVMSDERDPRLDMLETGFADKHVLDCAAR